MPFSYEDGAPLELRGETWRLTRAQRFEACTVLTLDGRDRSNLGERLRVIEPFDRPRSVASGKPRKQSRHSVMTSALAAIAGARGSSGLWAAARAAIDLWPYQLEPALAVVGGATRLLLADAVGLGKTIQAGLILSELGERGWIEHALIVCPAGLRATWARELRERFHIAAVQLDQASIAERAATLPPGVSPWSGHTVAIASIDFVKRPEVLAAIDREPIDLLIADEAHHLAPGTDRGAAVSRIASRSPWCVLVSATPHSGDRAAFAYLTSLGAAGDPMTIFRRRRSDAGFAVSRHSHLLPVRQTAEEAVLLDAIDRYARAIWAARGREDRTARLIAMTMARRAASSTAAISRTLSRRLALLTDTAVEPAQPALPWEETDDADDVEGDAVLGVRGLHSIEDERAALENLLALAARCATSSKIRRLLRILDRAREPAVIFTEYRDTLEAIVGSLTRSPRRVMSIHGGLAVEARRHAVEAFNGGDVEVLVATDAAGEGLNLHHRCRLVIDIELPWNPLRLEQRIGRVDRLGQRRITHAIRMYYPASIESAVLEHLRLRRRRAADALDLPVSEADVAAAIFDGESAAVTAITIPSVTIDTARTEAARLERYRLLTRFHAPASRTWAQPRRRSPSPLIALYRFSFSNTGGNPVGELLQGVRITRGDWPDDPRHWRELLDSVQSVLPRPHFENLTRHLLDARVDTIRSRLKREYHVRYQRSLFDRRGDADAAARQAVADRLEAALARVARGVTAPVEPDPRIELVAAWPESTR